MCSLKYDDFGNRSSNKVIQSIIANIFHKKFPLHIIYLYSSLGRGIYPQSTFHPDSLNIYVCRIRTFFKLCGHLFVWKKLYSLFVLGTRSIYLIYLVFIIYCFFICIADHWDRRRGVAIQPQEYLKHTDLMTAYNFGEVDRVSQ